MEVVELEEELLPVGTTPVHIAVNSGQIGALQNLLDRDCSLVDQPDHFGCSPLAKALQNGRLEAARLLILYGANLDTPYGTAPQPTLAQVLISDPAFVSLLHDVVIDSNTALHLDLSSVLPPLAYEGNMDMLKVVLSRHNVNVDYRDLLQCTGLHYASSRGLVEVVRLLLAHGVNRHFKTSVGATALHLACSAGHLEVVAIILEENLGSLSPKDLLSSKNRAGDTPIVCAFRNKRLEVVQYILNNHLEQLDLEQMLPNGHKLPGFCFYLRYWTSPSLVKSPFLYSSLPCLSPEESQWLLHESVHTDSLQGVREAIAHGASVECLDYMLQTPLMLAAKLGSVDMCMCLVEQGADLNVVDISGKTALVQAVEHGKHEVVEYFLSLLTCPYPDPYTLTCPITSPDMLSLLVSHLKGRKASKLVDSSDSWLAWLALAVPTASSSLFEALVNAVAPSDWVQHILCSESGASGSNRAKAKVSHKVATQPILPAYVQEDIVGDSHKPRPKLVRSFSQPRKWNFARAPPSITKEWKFKRIPPPKPRPILGKKKSPFILGRKRKSRQEEPSSVIHSAALHSLDVFRFILASCEDVGFQEKILLSKDEGGRTALELALPQFAVISDACSSLGLRETAGLNDYLTQEFPLPESLLFEEALLHYICVGQHVLSPQKIEKNQSPLQAWPLWYLQLQVNAFCLNNESGLLQLSQLKERKKLLDLLLDHNYFPADWSGDARGYMPPLFAAVQHCTSWAVEPLLVHGADPATHHRGRFAIEVAAKHGQVHTVQKLLESGLDPFLVHSGHQQLLFSLSSSLEYLIRFRLIEDAVNLLQGLNLGQYLWRSPRAPSFLYTAQAQCSGSAEYKLILRDFINFLGTKIANWENEESVSVVSHSMGLIQKRRYFKQVEASSLMSNVVLLANHAVNTTLRELLHSLCGHGDGHMVCFFLEEICSNTAARIVNQPDSDGYTPLFHAACGGHLDIARLLLHHGADVTNSSMLPPIVGVLLYLALAPHNIGGDILGNVQGKRYIFYRKRRMILEHYWKFLPPHSFSQVSDDPVGATELVKLLLPPPTESILNYLLDIPTPSNKMLTPLHLISAVRDSSVVEPVLGRILEELPVSCGRELSLEDALFVAPVATSTRSSQLFESFLVRFVCDALPLSVTDIFTAARKGYWGVVEAAVSSNKPLIHSLDREFVETCLLAIKFGKRDLLSGLLKTAQSKELPLSRWWQRLALAAVRADHPDLVNELLSAGCDVPSCLQAAVRVGSHKALSTILESAPVAQVSERFSEIVMFAAKSNHPSIVQSLFDFYQNHLEIAVESECSGKVAFWLVVLVGSTSHGHQSLALQAVAHISESEMNSTVTQHELYRSTLYYGCYWGLTDLLACLPYSESALLERQGERESPLKAAIANGRLGCVPSPPYQFPLWDGFKSWFDEGPLGCMEPSGYFSLLVTGLFHHIILNSKPSTVVQEYKSVNESKRYFLFRPHAFQVFEEFTGNFCAPLLVYAIKSGSLDIPYIAALEADSTLLKQILRVLFKSGYMAECFEHSRVGNVHSVAQYVHTSSLDLLLRCGEVFANRLKSVNDKGQNVLHSAVRSQGYRVEKLDLLLDQLGDLAEAMCFALDEQGHSPISLAFCLGKHERADRLLKVAVKSSSFNKEENCSVVKVAHRAHGWFRTMIESGDSSNEGDYTIFSIRDAPEGGIALFKKAAGKRNNAAVKALLVASNGFIITDDFVLVKALMNKTALDFLITGPSYVRMGCQDHAESLNNIMKRRDYSEVVIFLIKLTDEGTLQVSLDLHRLFSACCVLPILPVVKHFLSRTPSLPTEVLQKGAEEAFTIGALEVAAEILFSTDTTLTADFISGLSPVVKQIFIAPKDYQTTVEDFFESLSHPKKAGRLRFSEQWLAHEWRPCQRQLLEKAVQAVPTQGPPNPWMIGINWRGTPHTLEVTIDWESFRECLLESPLLVKQENTPMLVEAVVFSSSVLGQLYPSEESGHSTYSMADFFDCSQPPDYVVISSSKWPSPPFSESNKLCLSYRAQDRVFAFPPVVQRTERGLGDESYSTDSGMHSLCLTDTSLDTKEDECNASIFANGFKDVCRFHQRGLRRKHRISTDIAVEASGVDPSVLLSVFELCSEAIELSSLSATVYSRIHSSAIMTWRLPSPPLKDLFGHVGINIDSATEGKPSSVVVSLVDSGLDFSIALASENTSTSSVNTSTGHNTSNDGVSTSSLWTQLPPHEEFLQQTVDCTLHREVQLLRERLGRFVRTRFLPRLRQVLRSELDLDSVCLLLEDSSGNTTELRLATNSQLLLLKANSLIRSFLLSFCDMLQAYSYKPRVFSNIRNHLQQGLSIIISEVRQTDITVSPPGLRLTVHTNDLRQPQRQRALVSLTNSLLRLSQESSPECRDRDVNTLLGEVPCPFLTRVALGNSVNFLYPVVGSVTRLIVEVVGYGGNVLSLPLKYNCRLQVTIGSPSGKTLTASSSEDPTGVGGAWSDLFLTTSADGQFEVVWRPTEGGFHTVSISLNGIKISESFRRVYVEEAKSSSGKGLIPAGGHMVFIASHVGCACPFTSKNSRVVLLRDTVIEPSPLLRGFPGFETFTAPSPAAPPTTSSSSSSSSSSRPSDQLKKVVSSMTEPQDGDSDPPLPLLHHLSVTASHGSSRTWSHVPTSHVTVHISSQERQESITRSPKSSKPRGKKKAPQSRRVKKKSKKSTRKSKTGTASITASRHWSNPTCMSLGCGMYRVSLQCTKAGTYKVFASCPLCQSVMRIQWLESQSFYPQPFYMVPGPFSPVTTTVTDTNSGLKVDSSSYKPGLHSFYVNSRDSYGNAHTIGVINRAVIVGAGPINIGPDPSLEEVRASKRLDSECEVSYVGQGRYLLVCSLLGAGSHPLMVMTGDPWITKQLVITLVWITEDWDVCPQHCWLDPRNVYVGLPYKRRTCFIYLYDQYFNPYCNGHEMLVTVDLGTARYPAFLHQASATNRYMFTFTPEVLSTCHLRVSINGTFIADPPKTFTILEGESFKTRLGHFRTQVALAARHPLYILKPMIRVDRSKILETALANRLLLKQTQIVVNFEGENGIDAGGISSEFYQLLSRELINPQYALFHSSNGLLRPSPHSSINPSHLTYFTLCGEVMARTMCDNYQMCVRFTPAVYKFLLGKECTLTDLKAEDPTLYEGLMEVARCKSEESLGQLVTNFTTTLSHFGSLETVELGRGGRQRRVTLRNRDIFIHKFCHWHLIGCVKSQLKSMLEGFESTIPAQAREAARKLHWHELELLLCGQPAISVSFIRSRTSYDGYSASSQEIVWLWQVLESLSQEELSWFLQFTTGSGCLPVADTDQWKLNISRGSHDESLLPTAATCFNSLRLPRYTSKVTLQQKLMQAISLGHLHFCNH